MKGSHAVGIRFHDVSVLRGEQLILAQVSAYAPAGSATVLIGPNGAGKTTLLKCLLGEIPYSGSIEFIDSSGNRIARPVIGYVPQTMTVDAQLPLRVYEFLGLSGARRPLWLGLTRNSRQNARELLALVDAERLENRRLGDLSGGELRRVLLASALGRQPGLLVLDEAEAGVDYRGERLFWELLNRSRLTLGFTLLMVSHNLPLAAHYATNILCIKQRLVAAGAPRSTLDGPTLLELFGVPIHLYPAQCDNPGPACADCGAFGNSPYVDEGVPLQHLSARSAETDVGDHL